MCILKVRYPFFFFSKISRFFQDVLANRENVQFDTEFDQTLRNWCFYNLRYILPIAGPSEVYFRFWWLFIIIPWESKYPTFMDVFVSPGWRSWRALGSILNSPTYICKWWKYNTHNGKIGNEFPFFFICYFITTAAKSPPPKGCRFLYYCSTRN